LRRVRLILGLSVAMAAMVATTALPTAAQGFGPSVSCNAGTLEECTESAFLDSSKESFACEGKTRDAAISCTNRRAAETFPYCVYMGHEPSEDRDLYLCGPEPGTR
jgi:hypothetical protein